MTAPNCFFKTYVCNMSAGGSKATPRLLTQARFLCSHSAHENMFAEHQFMLTTFPHFTRHKTQCDRFPSNVFYGNDLHTEARAEGTILENSREKFRKRKSQHSFSRRTAESPVRSELASLLPRRARLSKRRE